MAKGTIAKQLVQDKIVKTFAEDFIGIVDKKIYIWANDGNEHVQIAISMTCPKNPIEVPEEGDDFEPAPAKEIELATPEEITDLFQRLGL